MELSGQKRGKLLRGLSKSQDFQRRITAGLETMKTSSVSIAAIARDCKPALKRNIPIIEKLCENFGRAELIIFENDSKDGTAEELQKWSVRNPSVHVFCETLNEVPIRPTNSEVRPWFSQHRIEKMANYRNKYLDWLDTRDPCDYVIMIDLDLAYISLDGIANSFGHSQHWDAISANGRIVKHLNWVYWDSFAFQKRGSSQPHNESEMNTVQNLLAGLAPGDPLLAVNSAFGGLVIYRSEAILGLRYRAECNGDPKVEALCEHVTFHADMRRNGHGEIFINPGMVVHYERYLPGKLYLVSAAMHSTCKIAQSVLHSMVKLGKAVLGR